MVLSNREGPSESDAEPIGNAATGTGYSCSWAHGRGRERERARFESTLPMTLVVTLSREIGHRTGTMTASGIVQKWTVSAFWAYSEKPGEIPTERMSSFQFNPLSRIGLHDYVIAAHGKTDRHSALLRNAVASEATYV